MQNMSSGETNEGFDVSYQALKGVVTHPKFQEVLTKIQSLPPNERLQAAFTQLTPIALAAKGIPIPEDLSITTSATQRLTSRTTNTADVVATGKGTADGSGLQIETRICIIPFIVYRTEDLGVTFQIL